MSVHVCKIDRSGTSGSLVYCTTCGFSSGPHLEAAAARKAAREHRAVTAPPRVLTDAQEERQRDAQRAARDRRRAARDERRKR